MTSTTNKAQGGLVIGRQAGESVIIGGAIRVKVLKEEHGLIRIRIEAPKEVSILREELCPDTILNPEGLYDALELHMRNNRKRG